MADPASIVLDNPGATGGAAAPPVGITVFTDAAGKPTATSTIQLTSISTLAAGGATTPTHQTTAVVTHTNTPAAATSSPESQAQQSPDLKVLLPAIVAPVVFVLLLASVLLFTCLHIRSKRRERLDSGEHGIPVETQPLHKKPSDSFLLPSPLADSDRTRDGSLGVYEKRKSMTEEAAKRNTDIIGMYERPSANGPAAYNYDGEKYTMPRMPAPMAAVSRAPPPPPQNRSPQGRTPPQSRPPPQNRAPPGSRSSPRDRSPMPPPEPQRNLKPKPSPPTSGPTSGTSTPRPAPSTTTQNTNTTDTTITQTVDSSWPLPSGGPLPSPNSMHSGKTGRSRKSSKSGNFQLPPVTASEPFSMREALRPESDTYDLSTSAATTVPKMPHPGAPGHPYDRKSRKRESDAVSQLSDRDRSAHSTDRLSVVSAMSDR